MVAHSKYLSDLSKEQYLELTRKILETQGHKCFICEKEIDLTIHTTNIDHIKPLANGGKDNELNFAVAHELCNKNKQDADLQIAKTLCRLEKIKEIASQKPQEKSDFGTSLADVLEYYDGAKYDFRYTINDDIFKYSFDEIENQTNTTKIFTDNLSGEKYVFIEAPLEYIFHDTLINPRGLNNNISKLIKEFYKGNPQLHLSLGRIDNNKIKIFDGQHKAVAQIMLGAKKLTLRLFIAPDVRRLTETNKNAGDSLRQVAFDKSVMRQLNSTLYNEKLDQYRTAKGLANDDYSFSEYDLVNFFRGENIRKYIIDSLKDSIRRDPANKLTAYIDMDGKGKKLPISYSTFDKTFLSLFINNKNILTTRMDYKTDQGENPRELERSQLIRLMNILADEIYIGKFNPEIGVAQIEDKIIKGRDEDITLDHLIAYRISKEEIMHEWLKLVRNVIKQAFAYKGKVFDDDESPFQVPFDDRLWQNITNFIRNLRGLPLWQNKQLAASVFSGKKNYDYWKEVFDKGSAPDGTSVLASPLNLIEMIQ